MKILICESLVQEAVDEHHQIERQSCLSQEPFLKLHKLKLPSQDTHFFSREFPKKKTKKEGRNVLRRRLAVHSPPRSLSRFVTLDF
jgi:hypothetical protein